MKKELIKKMTVGGRTYEILGFLKGDEQSEFGNVMIDMAKKMNAYLGSDDGEHILKHQNEIPFALRGKVVFVFPDWRHPDYPDHCYYVYWHRVKWVEHWSWVETVYWFDYGRLLRRK